MFMVLPSYVVKFQPEAGCDYWNWRVNSDEGLEAFCKVLRLNGITNYSVAQDAPFSQVATGLGHEA